MDIIRINSETYTKNPNQYELVSGNTEGAPKCPYGHNFEWVGYDRVNGSFVRFTKSVFKKLIQQKDNELNG